MDSAVSELLGGEAVLGPSISSNLDLARATREGLPTRAALELAREILEQEAHRELTPTDKGRLVWSPGDGHGLRTHLLRSFLTGSVDMLSACRAMRTLCLCSVGEGAMATDTMRTIGRRLLTDQGSMFGEVMGPLGAVIVSLIGEMELSLMRTRLTSAESDVVVRTATALARGTEVLGDKKKAIHWLNSPNKALGGEVPMSLLDTSAGEREVQSLLDRIEFGVYS